MWKVGFFKIFLDEKNMAMITERSLLKCIKWDLSNFPRVAFNSSDGDQKKLR